MQKTAIMTDSNCGILPEKGKTMGITVVPMPIMIDGNTYFEGVDLTAEEFYRRQKEELRLHLHFHHREVLWICGTSF